MKTENDNPKIYFPPPLIYIGMFLISLALQKFKFLNDSFFYTTFSYIIGTLILIPGLIINFSGLFQFKKTKNPIIPLKPAISLQTNKIYSLTRNPMYLGLLLLYSGLAFYFGNWWTIILIPVMVIIINRFVIRKEELYLERAFGDSYIEYKKKVRRWI